MRRLALAATIALALAPGAASDPGEPPVPRFAAGRSLTTSEGHATLEWSVPSGGGGEELSFELQQARTPDFSDPGVRHRGPEDSFFVSGLESGRTWFRVRALADGSTAGDWSAPLVVEVDYPHRGQVIGLLVAGCVVFLVTVGTIVTGWLRFRDDGTTEVSSA